MEQTSRAGYLSVCGITVYYPVQYDTKKR